MPIHCPECNRIVLDSTPEGGFKLRARILLFQPNGEANALCPTCKHPVAVPVLLTNVQRSQ